MKITWRKDTLSIKTLWFSCFNYVAPVQVCTYYWIESSSLSKALEKHEETIEELWLPLIGYANTVIVLECTTHTVP